jgi:O-antigen ligase/polysaccharide polymerase Wzy-like membrane protein
MSSRHLPDGVMSRQIAWIACIVYVIGYAGYCFSFNESVKPLRYLVYAVPFILVASPMLERIPRCNKPAEWYLLTYLYLGCIGYMTYVSDTDSFWNDFGIVALVILSFVATIDVDVRQIRFVFSCTAIYFVAAYVLTEHQGLRVLQLLETGIIARAPPGTAYDSDTGGLVPPIYAVFYYAIGARLEFMLALVMCFVGGKRISLLAVLVGLAAVSLFQRAPALNESRNRFLVLFAALAGINIVGANLPSIVEQGYWAIRPDAHIEEIMLGRQEIGSTMIEVIENRSWVEWLIGAGPGSANSLAGAITNGSVTHPHNDWLKLLFDHGVLGSTLITAFMALVFSSSKNGTAIALVNAVIMLTDNVAAYLFYQTPIVLMLAFCALQESRRSENTLETGFAFGLGSRGERLVR